MDPFLQESLPPLRISECNGVVMGAWRAHWKEYEEDVERFKREAKDRKEGDKVARVRDGEEKDWEEGSSVSMSLTMDVGLVRVRVRVRVGPLPLLLANRHSCRFPVEC